MTEPSHRSSQLELSGVLGGPTYYPARCLPGLAELEGYRVGKLPNGLLLEVGSLLCWVQILGTLPRERGQFRDILGKRLQPRNCSGRQMHHVLNGEK